MTDRLAALLQHFELRARVFQAGPMRHVADYAADGLGYIHVLQAGVLRVETASSAPLRLDEPSLFLCMNPTAHRLTPQDDRVEMICASVEFGPGMRNPIAGALPGIVVVRLAEMPRLRTTLDLLFEEGCEDHCGRQAILDRLIEVVIIQVLRELMDQQRLRSGLLAGLAEPRLAKAINAVHAAPARAWSLAGLATEAGMSRARFAAHFRAVVGMTPMAYLSDWRIGLAQSLLSRGKPVQLVADLVGYGSASALSRSFKSLTGQTPTEWVRRRGSA